MNCTKCGKEILGVAVMSPTLNETERQMCPTCAKQSTGMHIFHVNIPNIDAQVMIIDDLNWDDDKETKLKSFLSEFYDVPKDCVDTDKEYEDLLFYEKQKEKQYEAEKVKVEQMVQEEKK